MRGARQPSIVETEGRDVERRRPTYTKV